MPVQDIRYNFSLSVGTRIWFYFNKTHQECLVILETFWEKFKVELEKRQSKEAFLLDKMWNKLSIKNVEQFVE